jgi:hypothetical protein
MEAAMSRGLATEAESTAAVPLSPELVLVSPELRERALRELELPRERNGVKPHSDLLYLARERHESEHRHPAPEAPLLRVAGAAVVRVAALSVVFVLAVAGAAFGLTIAPDGTEPRLALPLSRSEGGEPVGRAWRSTGEIKPSSFHSTSAAIGTAVVDAGVSRQIVWDLEALAVGSTLRLSKQKRAPLLPGRAVPLKLGSGYISCGPQRWIAAGADFALSCVQERPNRGR